MKKIRYAIVGVVIGIIIYMILLKGIPTTEAGDVTLLKPEIHSSGIVGGEIEPENNDYSDLDLLNKNFKAAYDKRGNVIAHPSGYKYVYDKNLEPVGLMDDSLSSNIEFIVEYDENDSPLPHESGNEYVYDHLGKPVGLLIGGVVSFSIKNPDPTPTISGTMFANSYYLNSSDVKLYESMNAVNFGQSNPMWHEVIEKEIEIADIPDRENSIGDIIGNLGGSGNSVSSPIYEDDEDDMEEDNTEKPEEDNGSDEYQLSPGETVGYDVNTGDLRIVSVSDIESRVSAQGKLPVDREFYNITSQFGLRRDPIVGDERFHVGLDIASSGINGRYVYSILDGNIEVMSFNNSLGNYMVVSHGSFNTVYAHLEAFGQGIKVGDSVSAGDPIGYVGNTGRSTGPHLHVEFDVRGVKLNPEVFLNKLR